MKPSLNLFRRFELSAVFMLLVIVAASLVPLMAGYTPLSLLGAAGVVAVSTLLVKLDWSHSSPYALRGQAGDVGAQAPEIKKAILDALKERDTELTAKLKTVEDDIKATGKIHSDTADAVAGLMAKGEELMARLTEVEQRSVQPAGRGGAPLVKSVGEQFGESDELKSFVKRGAKGHSSKFELKNITSVAGSAGPSIYSDRLSDIIQNPLRPLSVRALLDNGTTESSSIEWIQELLFTNAAAAAAEGTLKPQSEITYQRQTIPVRTLAHWVKATKQVLADSKMLMSMIDGRLTEGLKVIEDGQLIAGDGTGENILGLIPQATAYTVAQNVAGDTKIDTIRRAILQVFQSYYPATGIVLNPVDWAAMELLKETGTGRYVLGSAPQATAQPSLWGLPVAQSFALPAGKFLVGSFRLAATVFDREEAAVYVSTEDGDNFVRNMVTILAEERLALAVTSPKAFIYGSFP